MNLIMLYTWYTFIVYKIKSTLTAIFIDDGRRYTDDYNRL